MALPETILAALAEGPRHGYAIRTLVRTWIGPFWPVSQGQIYATLTRLTRSGRVEELGGGLRSRYALTERGRRQLTAWMTRPAPSEARGFDDWFAQLSVAVAAHDEVAIGRCLHAHRERCQTLLEALTRDRTAPALRAACHVLDAELEWIDGLARELLAPGGHTRTETPSHSSRPGELVTDRTV